MGLKGLGRRKQQIFVLVRESAETQEDPMGDDLFISLRVHVRWLRVHVTLSKFQWGPSAAVRANVDIHTNTEWTPLKPPEVNILSSININLAAAKTLLWPFFSFLFAYFICLLVKIKEGSRQSQGQPRLVSLGKLLF